MLVQVTHLLAITLECGSKWTKIGYWSSAGDTKVLLIILPLKINIKPSKLRCCYKQSFYFNSFKVILIISLLIEKLFWH